MRATIRGAAQRALRWLAARLGLIVKIMVADVIICSTGFAFAEGTGPVSALWWGVVTQSTTGYGDYSPATTIGRFFGTVLMVSMQFLIPLFQAALTAWVIVDPDAWTNNEQRRLLGNIARIIRLLVVLIRETRATRAEVREVRAMLTTLSDRTPFTY